MDRFSNRSTLNQGIPHGIDIGNIPIGAKSLANTLILAPNSLPTATVGAAYNQTITASGGTGPYTYSVSVGSLPHNLSLNSSTGVYRAE